MTIRLSGSVQTIRALIVELGTLLASPADRGSTETLVLIKGAVVVHLTAARGANGELDWASFIKSRGKLPLIKALLSMWHRSVTICESIVEKMDTKYTRLDTSYVVQSVAHGKTIY